MCGIVGYIGNNDVKEILLYGLEKMEYRGYDSAGIGVRDDNEVKVFKEKGRIKDLREKVDMGFDATVGIGHTRWATTRRAERQECTPAPEWMDALRWSITVS